MSNITNNYEYIPNHQISSPQENSNPFEDMDANSRSNDPERIHQADFLPNCEQFCNECFSYKQHYFQNQSLFTKPLTSPEPIFFPPPSTIPQGVVFQIDQTPSFDELQIQLEPLPVFKPLFRS